MPKISLFLSKTYALLSEPCPYARWAHPGEPFSFIITQPIPFAAEVLPRHFKHNNLPSFARQLNLFGFHKAHAPDTTFTFTHPLFVAGRADLLEQITAKKTARSPCDEEAQATLVQENERLTRELERSEAQRQALQAYISQLLTVVAYNQDDGGAKRKRVTQLPVPPPPVMDEPRTPTSFMSLPVSPSPSSDGWQALSPASSVQSPMDLTGEADNCLPSASDALVSEESLPVAAWHLSEDYLSYPAAETGELVW
jgi:hypothetical protein